MKSIAIKSLATLAVAGLVLSSFGAALSVQAATTTTTPAFATDLTLGSKGADVTALQNWLIGKGFSVPAGATGYFGAQTKAALAAYQTSAGITPAAGYFGPITRAKVNAGGSTTTTTGTTGMTGTGEGYLDEFDQLSKYSTEEVGEGDENVIVLGEEFEAKDADQKIERVTLTVKTPTGNDDLEDLVDSITLNLDGKKLATMDVADASHSKSTDVYTFRFTGLNGVVKEGDVAELTVGINAADNIDASDAGDGWTVDFAADNIRAVSPNGVDDTYGSAIDETFTVNTFASANDVELKVALGDDNLDSQSVAADTEDDTEDVELLQGTLKAKGSDINVDELPLTLTVTGATDVDFVTSKVTLKINGDEYTETVSTSSATSATIVFDNLDLDIDEGDTVDFTVTADINDFDANFEAGDTLTAAVTSTNVAYIDATDETGEDLASGDLTGTATGNAMSFYETGLTASFKSASTAVVDGGTNAYDGTGTFTIKYKVTAFGGDVYVSTTATATVLTTGTTSDDAVSYFLVDKTGTATADATGVITVAKASGSVTETATAGYYKITEGSSADITLQVFRTNGAVGQGGGYRASLVGIGWGTTSVKGDATNLYKFDLEDYKTEYASIN